MKPILLAIALGLLGSLAQAQAQPQVLKGADIPLGERLLAQHRCAACHAQKVGGDGSAIYRPKGRIGSPSALLAMVEQCNTELGLSMFPDEVMAISAVLNRDHYRFP